MQLNIFPKLFLATLFSMMIMVVVMIVFINMSFRTGFADYLHSGELTKVNRFIEILSEEYDVHGDWDFIHDSPREWNRLRSQIRGFLPPNKRRPRHDGRPPPRKIQKRPSHDSDYLRGRPPKPLGDRIVLLDIDKQLIIGRPYQSEATSILEIRNEGLIVGYISVWQGLSNVDNIADIFIDQQFRNFSYIAALAILLAILSAVLLARQFVRPLKDLHKAVAKLSSGESHSSIKITSNDELGKLAEDFNQLASILEKNDIQRKQWLVDISHELRTPISILRSEIEAMLDGIRESNQERIRSLHTDVMSLGKLVEDLYQLSLSDSSEFIKDDTPVDLVDIINKAANSVGSLLKQKHIELKLSNPKKLIVIEGNNRSLHQLFSNLLANSFRYTNDNGCIEISVENKTDSVEIIIQDSAPGVPEESLPLLFDRLYRVDKSRNRELGGSGLGLSICAKIVAEHGGDIWAEHSPLGGLLIRVKLPLSDKKIDKFWKKQ